MSESVRAELSAVAEAVGSYRARMAALVEAMGPGNEELLSAVYEAERALHVAHRLLARAEKLSG